MSRVDQATGQPVAFSLTPLDCRADRVRTEESAVGNLIADILMHSYEDALRERDKRGEFEERRPEDVREIDMCLICGGSLRGDSVFGPGSELRSYLPNFLLSSGYKLNLGPSAPFHQPLHCETFSPLRPLKTPSLSRR